AGGRLVEERRVDQWVARDLKNNHSAIRQLLANGDDLQLRTVTQIRCAIAGVFSRKYLFFFQAEGGIRDLYVTGVQTCALPILAPWMMNSDAMTCPIRVSGEAARRNSR